MLPANLPHVRLHRSPGDAQLLADPRVCPALQHTRQYLLATARRGAARFREVGASAIAREPRRALDLASVEQPAAEVTDYRVPAIDVAAREILHVVTLAAREARRPRGRTLRLGVQ